MRSTLRARDSYGSIQASTGVAGANGAMLIQMLFDGLLDSLSAARGHIQHGATREKGAQISRACRIIIGLQSALDFERGGELARNLDELYGYVSRRLVRVNAYNDLEALDEVFGLMRDIRDAWQTLPAMTVEPARALAVAN
jgi:flagellar protein FliS